MKLEVGMYVRTNKVIIEKVLDILEFNGEDYYLNFINVAVLSDIENIVAKSKGKIIKASYNLIDLIEVGDYVNGKQVIKKWNEPFGEFVGQDFMILDGETSAPTIRTIKSVVTKEQFESMSYKVGENSE